MTSVIHFSVFILLLSLASTLRICHHNDFHARYAAINRFNSPCSEEDSVEGKCYSSSARIKHFFDYQKCDVRVMAGDFVQGSVYDTLFGVDIAIDMYKAVGYDIATFGNHEFNKGPEPVYRTVLETSANMTWLASNVHFHAAPENFSVASSVVKGDVCWVGAVTEITKQISNPGPNVTFSDAARSLRNATASCGPGAAGVIAVTHLGYDQDVALCHAVQELDLVIGGHSHSDLGPGALYPTKITRFDGSVCWVVTALAFGRYVGVLDVVTGPHFSFGGYQYVPMDGRVDLDAKVSDLLATKFNVTGLVEQVVGNTTAPIDGDRNSCRAVECQMGNLVCDAMLAYAGPKQGAVACLLNGGGLRASIDEGPITLGEVLSVLPFANVHATITLPGAGLVKALEIGFVAISDSSASGRFPQVGGMIVDVDYTATPGQRVKSITIAGKPLDLKAEYTIVTNGFMATGGDGYEWEGAIAAELSGRGLDTLLIEYLAEKNPYTPFTEGRINDVSGTTTEA